MKASVLIFNLLQFDLRQVRCGYSITHPCKQPGKGHMEQIGIGIIVNFPFQTLIGFPLSSLHIRVVRIPVIQIILLIMSGTGNLIAAEQPSRSVRIPTPCSQLIFTLGIQRNKRNRTAEYTLIACSKNITARTVTAIRIDRRKLCPTACIEISIKNQLVGQRVKTAQITVDKSGALAPSGKIQPCFSVHILVQRVIRSSIPKQSAAIHHNIP